MILLLILGYIVGQMIYVYYSDAKISSKCKTKSGLDTIGILIKHIYLQHIEWYRDSQLEDIVQEVKHTAQDFGQQAKDQAYDIANDIKKEGSKIIDTTYSQSADQHKSKTKKSHTKKKTS